LRPSVNFSPPRPGLFLSLRWTGISRKRRVLPTIFPGFAPEKIVSAHFSPDYYTAPVLSPTSVNDSLGAHHPLISAVIKLGFRLPRKKERKKERKSNPTLSHGRTRCSWHWNQSLFPQTCMSLKWLRGKHHPDNTSRNNCALYFVIALDNVLQKLSKSRKIVD